MDDRRYDEEATRKLAQAAGRYFDARRYSGRAEPARTDDFLTVMDIELEHGADPTYRMSLDTHSALDALLSVGENMCAADVANYRVTVDDLLKRTIAVLPQPLYYVPDYIKPLSPPAVKDKELWVAQGPVSILLDARLPAEDMRRRLKVVLEAMGDIDRLLRPQTILKNSSFNDRPVLYVPPLLEAVRVGDCRTCDLLLLEAERAKEEMPHYELDDILNARVRILYKEEEMGHAEAMKALTHGGVYRQIFGETVMHEIVRQMSEMWEDGNIRYELIDLLGRSMDDGADPDIKNTDGLTPYGLACELGVKYVVECPRIFRDDPSVEFAIPDRNGRWLTARLLDEMEDAMRNSGDVRDTETKLLVFLDVYRSVKDTMPQKMRIAHDSMLQNALSRMIGISAECCDFFKSLVESGADPRYAVPGRFPIWQEAVMRYGCGPSGIALTRTLLETPVGEGPSLSSTMTDGELNWLRYCGAEKAYRMSLDVELKRCKHEKEREPDGPVR